tara:strand:+ start:2204 stop:2440 length:237 start_codon:yes stop_codon:yes gene_type:complete
VSGTGISSRVQGFVDELLGENARIGVVTRDDAAKMVDAVSTQADILESDLTETKKELLSEQALDDWWVEHPDLIDRLH